MATQIANSPIEFTLNQSLTWLEQSGTANAAGEEGFEAPRVIPARIESRKSERTDQNGETVVTNTRIFTTWDISIGDRVDLADGHGERIVEDVDDLVNFDGVIGYEVFTK